MRELRTDIVIEAPADRVWRTITDFEAYPTWNPFMLSLSLQEQRDPGPGARLTVVLQAPGHRATAFHPVVLSFEPGRGVSWLGSLWVKGLFDGEHHLEVESLGPTRSRFVQWESYRGALVPLAGRLLRDTLRGFQLMNQALKARVEGGLLDQDLGHP